MVFFDPFTSDEPGSADTLNARFAQMQAAIEARAGSFFTYQQATVLVDSQANITIPISQIVHSTLMLVLLLRTDRAVAVDDVGLQLNENTTSGYAWQVAQLVGGAFAFNNNTGSHITLQLAASGASAAADRLAYSMVTIEAAMETSAKLVIYDNASNASGNRAHFGSGSSPVMGALTSLTLFSPTANSFVAGSSYALYGM